MLSKKTLARKRSRKQYIAAERERVRNQFGYTRMVERGLRAQRPDMPDLTVESRYKTSDVVGNGFAKPSLPPDAKAFPVGLSHKQGPMLITRADRLEDMGGKKT